MLTKIVSKSYKRIKKFSKVIPFLMFAAIYHSLDPTLVPRLKYLVSDINKPKIELEKKFDIDYEGYPNEKIEKNIQDCLENIERENPLLLKYCRKIVYHNPKTLDLKPINYFIYFDGRAFNFFGEIELCSVYEPLLAHELAHLYHYNVSKKFNQELDEIFDDSYGFDLKPNWCFLVNMPNRWNDDSTEPRNGFISPYGAKNKYENVAEYIEKVYDDGFNWENPELHRSPKYKKTLKLLEKYGFITPKQLARIEDEMILSDPVFLKSFIETNIPKIEEPILIRREETDYSPSNVLYEDSTIKLSHCWSFVPFFNLELKLTPNKSKSVTIKWDENSEKLISDNDLDCSLNLIIIEHLRSKGYETFGNCEKWLDFLLGRSQEF